MEQGALRELQTAVTGRPSGLAEDGRKPTAAQAAHILLHVLENRPPIPADMLYSTAGLHTAGYLLLLVRACSKRITVDERRGFAEGK